MPPFQVRLDVEKLRYHVLFAMITVTVMIATICYDRFSGAHTGPLNYP